MDVNGKRSVTGEISMTENKKGGDVVVTISSEERDLKSVRGVTESPHRKSVDSHPEHAVFSPSPNRPPRIPNPETLTRRKTLTRSVYSKPKSRFGEPSSVIDHSMLDNMHEPVVQTSNSPSPIRIMSNRASPTAASNTAASPLGTPSRETTRTISITPKTPLMASPGGAGGVDEEEEIYKKVKIRKKLEYQRVRMKVLFEWIVFLLLLGCLVASLTVNELKRYKIWSLELWKWLVLKTVIICGMLVTNKLMHFIVLLIELNFLLRKKVLYFVHGLKKSVQTLLLKILATSFHVSNFFDRIQESIFLQYALLTLSGPPVMESLQMVEASTSTSQLSFQVKRKGKEAKTKEVIDVGKLHQMKREKVSAWTMKMLVDVISSSGLSTFSGELEESAYDGPSESADKEITNEMEAIAAAYHIFQNVAQPGSRYIEDLDLRRFMIKEEVDIVFPLIDVADKGHIDRKTLTEWVVKVYKERKALAHALSDTRTAVKQLDKLVTTVLIVVVFVVWLLLTEIASTKVLVLLSSQLVVAAFIFGNTCKTIFEAIVFVFIMHPFDVGDRCVVDGVQMIVEEMNILTTVFLRYDNEKIYYPNVVLSTKPISNFYRSPDMGDGVEFSIDFATSFAQIAQLKEKIRKYLEKNPQLWHPNHSLVVKEIENVNKIKMALYFTHTMNFQDFGEKNRRRSELVLELKKFFEELNIKCHLLPQEVHLHHPEITSGHTK
ncbi:putative mechanosensitive ion channel MscS, LSM domain superfamily [Helianthus annuus]|uniref:Mechanosensitive ion channel protein n=1 Tax=Helianthus annuus TaxID=4232 RepID=A0A9K3N5Q2_HELAN|nr:putative mechanosensitive ion channel MscS, LSM domain superfamily [Helianthus annuus]